MQKLLRDLISRKKPANTSKIIFCYNTKTKLKNSYQNQTKIYNKKYNVPIKFHIFVTWYTTMEPQRVPNIPALLYFDTKPSFEYFSLIHTMLKCITFFWFRTFFNTDTYIAVINIYLLSIVHAITFLLTECFWTMCLINLCVSGFRIGKISFSVNSSMLKTRVHNVY